MSSLSSEVTRIHVYCGAAGWPVEGINSLVQAAKRRARGTRVRLRRRRLWMDFSRPDVERPKGPPHMAKGPSHVNVGAVW